MGFVDRLFYVMGYQRSSVAAQPVSQPMPVSFSVVAPQLEAVSPEMQIVGSYPVPMPETQKNVPAEFQKNAIQEKLALSQDPTYMALQKLQVSDQGLRKPSKITFLTLRRMGRANWVMRTCINTLRDEITAIPWDIVPIGPKRPYSEGFRQYLIDLLKKPNRNNENWRTFIDKTMEDILALDAGCIELVRDQKGRIVELWNVDGASIKPIYDEYGMICSPAFQQYFPTTGMNEPVAEFDNNDLMYVMWNPQGAVDLFPYGLSPVESGLSVATAFLYAEAYNMGFFNQNTIPTTIINMGKNVPPGQVDSFKSFLLNEMQGVGGFWKPIVGSFAEGFSVNPVLKTPADLALKEYVEWQMKWIVSLFRMSPQDIGFGLDQYKVEGEVQQQLSKNKAIDSLKNVLAENINGRIVNDKGWEFSTSEINLQFQWIDTTTIDPMAQAGIDDLYIKNGTLAINEIRKERFGKDPVVGGQKSYIMNGPSILPLDNTPLDIALDLEEEAEDNLDEVGKSVKTVEKKFSPEEGVIESLANNQTAIAWMDDRGVTQPLFITDFGKNYGFTIKPNFLDERREQDPPEATVSQLLRMLQVNTPLVKIMSYDEAVKLLPVNLYPQFTKWINLEAPYDSQEWRQRWGNTRMSQYYIVTGFITGRDLNNMDLIKEMATSPESYKDAITDLSRVWLAEKKFFLGDRKPGHYIITNSNTGFGVDYQFYDTEESWNRTSHWLPETLAAISPVLKGYFDDAIQKEFVNFNILEKAFRPKKIGDPIILPEDVEKKMALRYQHGMVQWYRKAIHVDAGAKTPFLLKKAIDEFDPNEDYITNGQWVWQNGRKYPANVLSENLRPSVADLQLDASVYKTAYDLGVETATVKIKPNLPDGLKVSNPEMYTPAFQRRANLIADTSDKPLRKLVDDILSRGFEQDVTYQEVADSLQGLLGINLDDPDFPGWRAMRIARTETNWAINEGMRDQYKETGITRVNISLGSTACDECVDAAHGNPYTVEDANDLLPLHPNCRCVLVGDFSDFGLK